MRISIVLHDVVTMDPRDKARDKADATTARRLLKTADIKKASPVFLFRNSKNQLCFGGAFFFVCGTGAILIGPVASHAFVADEGKHEQRR